MVYVNFSPSYKNPVDSGSSKGVKITLDSTSYWNGQTMRRTEIIPQTTAVINAGIFYFHFSMKRSATNPPSIYREHQINFFDSYFTEMKAGWISGEAETSDPLLRWDVGGVTCGVSIGMLISGIMWLMSLSVHTIIAPPKEAADNHYRISQPAL
jgi:hypothetical protein